MAGRFSFMTLLLFVFVVLLSVYWFGFKGKVAPSASPVPTAYAVSLIRVDQSKVQEIKWASGSAVGTLALE
jgi:hypothetical protein